MFEFLFELVFQIIAELAAEALRPNSSKPWVQPGTPLAHILGICGFAAVGAIVAALTLKAYPTHVISSPLLRVVNLLVSPLLVGFMAAISGAALGQSTDAGSSAGRFMRGMSFALAFSLVRFFVAA